MMEFKDIQEKVQDILIMYPDNIDYKIKIVKNRKAISKEYFRIYRIKPPRKVPGFYSIQKNTIFMAKWYLSDTLVAHEICHVVLDREYKGTMPVHVQEMICQGIEQYFD